MVDYQTLHEARIRTMVASAHDLPNGLSEGRQ
jgi:hypothetical protein